MKESNDLKKKVPAIQIEASLRLNISDWRMSYGLNKRWLIAAILISVRIAIAYWCRRH